VEIKGTIGQVTKLKPSTKKLKGCHRQRWKIGLGLENGGTD